MGRKAIENKKRMVSVKLPPYIIDWLRGQNVSQSKLIEEALGNHFKIKSPN